MKFLNQIPILDCSKIKGNLEDIENEIEFHEFVTKFGDAMREVGFAYFINHDIETELINDVMEKSKDFFELPSSIKEKYTKVDPLKKFFGFTGFQVEKAGELGELEGKTGPVRDAKESFDFCGLSAHVDANYPCEVPNLKVTIDALRSSLHLLTQKLLRGMAMYLEMNDLDFFIRAHDNELKSNHIRSIFYPPTVETSDDSSANVNNCRLGEHCDWGTFTYLFQDEIGGLEAKMPSGHWIPVSPIKDSIVFNSGLMMEAWTGGLFPASPHRVMHLPQTKEATRQSIVVFIAPNPDATCIPVISEQATWSPTYPKIGADAYSTYFKKRLSNMLDD